MKLVLLATLIAANAFALLPPFAQAERELKEILNYPELHEFIPYSDVFEEIAKTEEGYLIKTNKREVRVIVHYKENSKIGPLEFSIEFVQ
jgi:hypothetical protein